MERNYLNYFFCAVTYFALAIQPLFAQSSSTDPAKDTKKETPAKPQSDKSIIDSLRNHIDLQNASLDSLDSLLDNEKQASADLREEVIRLDNYRQKLESNVNSFKGENLKLNQSNRILIVFNSLVAVLLIISLIFFIRKIGRKRAAPPANNNNNGNKTGEQVRFTSFEDKLLQLERLGKLREKELLSEEEFLVEKQKILGKQ